MSVFSQLMMKKRSGFKILDYIQSHGKQYIDTGFVPNQDTKIEMVCEVLVRSNSPYLFGSGQGWEDKAFALAFNNSSSVGLIFCYGQYSSKRTGNNFQINQKYRITFSKSYLEVYNINTQTITYSASNPYNAQTFSAGANALIFWTSWANNTEMAEKMKLYSLKIWDNGTLVRDFVPVLNTSTGERGVLDNVENKFYGNSGTGEFLGSDQMILTTVGSPTVTDGVVSGLTDKQNTVETMYSIDVGDNAWEMQLNILNPTKASIGLFRTNNNNNTRTTLTSTYGIASYLNYSLNSDNPLRATDLADYWNSLVNSAPSVFIKFSCSGKDANNKYPITIGISTDGKTWQSQSFISDVTLASGVIMFASTYGSYATGTSVEYELNLNNSYFAIAGTKYKYVIA